MIALLVFIFATLELLAEKGIFGSNVFKVSCKTSTGISTHFADDVWSSCVVDPGESTYAGFGTFNAGWCRLMQLLTPDYNHLQHYIVTFIIKAVQKSRILRRIHGYLLPKGQVMLGGLDMKLGKSKSME